MHLDRKPEYNVPLGMKQLKATVGTKQVLVLESFHSPIPQRVEPNTLDLHALQKFM